MLPLEVLAAEVGFTALHQLVQVVQGILLLLVRHRLKGLVVPILLVQ
jgi:hypothetical protein